MKLRKNKSESQHRMVGSQDKASRKASKEGSSFTSCSKQGQLLGQAGWLSALAGLTNLEMFKDLTCNLACTISA